MMDRYSITEGMYNIFDHRVQVKNLDDVPVFLHEYYHHIQNISTILGAERLNFVVQFLAHTRGLTLEQERLLAPFNRWFDLAEKEETDETLKRRLENIVRHQEEWLYLDKITYQPQAFRPDELTGPHLSIVEEEERESVTPYVALEEEGQLMGYPVGGFTLTESGAYALQLYHSPEASADVLKHINPFNYQYLAILRMVHEHIPDFRLACLATFLMCDLAMIISSPAVGFFAAHRMAPFFSEKIRREEQLFQWYETTYSLFFNEIKNNIASEVETINFVRSVKQGLNVHIDNMLEWQLQLMEKGLHLRLEDKMGFLNRLLSGKQADLDYLMQAFPLTLIETTEDGMLRYETEEDLTNYELLNASYHLFLGLCRNFNHISTNKDIIHTRKINDNHYIFELVRDVDQSDAFGYMIHTLGLNDKPLKIIR